MANHRIARARRSSDKFADAEAARRALCAMLFDDPAVVVDCLSHEVTQALSIKPHTHTDLIQFDIIAGCGGQVFVADQVTPIRSTTLMVAYPGQPHGYMLLPGEPPSEAWLVKLRVPRGWRQQRVRPFPVLLTGLPPQVTLMDALIGFISCWTKQSVNTVGLASLAHALAAWPTHLGDLPDDRQDPIPADGVSAMSRVRRVAHTLAHRSGDQPGLEELADAAGLSPRHFARLFREAFGCTPHAYVAAHRLDASRRLLLTPGVTVAQAAEQMGFMSSAAFSRWFTRQAGQSPRRFREDPYTF